MDLKHELRDLALSLDAGTGKSPFDIEGYRRIVYEMAEGKTEEEIQREIEAIKKITPDHSWPGWRGRLT
jgi:hypothetical protein